MALAIVVTGLIGLFIERVLRPLENKDFTLMLIGTIGFGMVLQAVAVLIWGATGRAVPSPVTSAPLNVFGLRIRTFDLVILFIAAVAVVLLVAFLQRTKQGAAMQAVAMDHAAATAVGIHIGRSNAMAFASGFAAAMLGGCGNLPGAIVGGLAIGVLDSFAAGHFQGYSELVVFLTFTVIMMIRPTGLFGEMTVNRA